MRIDRRAGTLFKSVRGKMLLAAALGTLAGAPAAAAGTANRTFVSGTGSDSNPCTITQPCRSLQAAVTATAAAGEVVTQSITIANDGVGTASISVPSGGTGITIQAGASDTVQLRGLEIDGNNAGSNIRIDAQSVGALSVLNCVVRHLYLGLYSESGNNNVVSNSVFSDMYAAPSDNSFRGDGIAVFVSTIAISNTLLSGNSNAAVYVSNGNGTQSAAAIIDHDTIMYNKVGLYNSNNNGTTKINSYQNSNISFNTTADTTGTITAVTPK